MKKTSLVLAALVCGISLFGAAACAPGEAEKTYSVYAPDGAPALSLASVIAEDDGAFSCHVIDSAAVQTYVTGKQPAADFCVLPVNLASKLLGTGETYQMLGTVTNGNLYFLTTDGEAITGQTLSLLVGKKVGVVQLANVPGLTFEAMLKANSLSYSVCQPGSEADPNVVNLVAVDAQTGVTPAGGCDYYLCPEPAASAKVKGTADKPKKLVFAGDLQALYGDGEGYPQAVLVARRSVIEQDPQAVETLVSYFEESEAYLASVSAETVVSLLDGKRTEGLAPSFTAANLTAEVIAHCSVRYTPSKQCRETVDAFLSELISVKADAASAVAESFYYLG